MTHTLEVAGICRAVARALRLNEDLTEAIALGHDLGHPPFGHTGEDALDEVLHRRGRRFRHNEQSLRVVEVLERGGEGLNLTEEVREGILRHTGPHAPATLEGRIVRLVDRFAYVNHDIDDAIRAEILSPGALPPRPITLLGASSSARIDALVHDLVETSDPAGDIAQSPAHAEALLELRRFMFEHVYLGEVAVAQKEAAVATIADLFEVFVSRPDLVGDGETGADDVTRAADWVAGMTDRFCLETHERLVRAPSAASA
jgi:dGTPase